MVKMGYRFGSVIESLIPLKGLRTLKTKQWRGAHNVPSPL